MSQCQFETAVVFDQADIQLMRRALECACLAMAFAFSLEGGVDDKTRESLASSIIMEASTGERNPARLSEAALRRLPPKIAEWEPIEAPGPAAQASSKDNDAVLREYA